MTTYRGSNRRRNYGRQMTGPRPNTYAGLCATCGKPVAAKSGILTGSKATGYTVTHGPTSWNGSPISGGWVGGCPESTDAQNAALGHVDNSYVRNLERSEKIDVTGVPGSSDRSRYSGSKHAYTSTGARMTNRFQRCEDAPCCGCCN